MNGTAPSDGELIARVATGDRTAFDELYRRFARAVFGLALRRSSNRSQAEDATQETFASLWRSASTYDPDRGPGASWLYAIARNAIVDIVRRSPSRATPEIPEIPSAEAEPPERAEAAWLAWRVHRALAVLTELERPVIELAYWGGLSQSEIAGTLELPLGTVKTRTRSGLARLARELEGELA